MIDTPEVPEEQPTSNSASLREAASELWQMFLALTDVGFSEAQALHLVTSVMLADFGVLK